MHADKLNISNEVSIEILSDANTFCPYVTADGRYVPGLKQRTDCISTASNLERFREKGVGQF